MTARGRGLIPPRGSAVKNEPLRVLVVEDHAEDAELMGLRLEDEGYDPQLVRVETEPAYASGLDATPDLILSDWRLPAFSGLRALQMVRGRAADIPFIIVSGSVGEEAAIDAMRQGADDYVLKDRLARLGPAVRRAMEGKRLRDERRRVLDALVASELRYAAIFEGAAEAILVADVATQRFRWANPAACAMLGYSQDELTRLSVSDIHPPRDLPRTLAHFQGLAEGGATVARSVSCRRRDGSTLLVDISGSTAQVDGVPCTIGFLTDVTELRALAAERERLVAAMEQTPDAIGITDAVGTLVYANAALGTLAGRSVAELVGGPAIAIMGPGMAGRSDALLGRLRTGRVIAHAFAGVRPDGSTFRAEGTVAPVRDVGGVITHFVLTARDVTHLREVEADLALEGRVRTVLAEALLESRPVDSLEDSVQQLCDQLGNIKGIDYAGVEVFEGDHGVVVLASHVPPGFAIARGVPLLADHAAYVRERAATGAWAEYWDALPEDGVFDTLMRDIDLKAIAVGPIAHGDHVDGLLVIGTRQDEFARTLVERQHALLASSTTTSALLAERLHARRHEVQLRRSLLGLIAARAFHPVFQPIVDLASGEVVGYEALTRFDSGQRPDLCFADAWSVGLGPELELATLERSAAEARELPAGRWLNLNASARLLPDRERLRAIFASARRPIAVEVTEHEVIDDYRAVRDAVRALGHDLRLAVDDAGAGVANFTHIVELRPDFVKLDISLVRRVNADLGRQALVVGMHHFSRTAGCRLIAEGVETEAEARALQELGVEFGQGYWFGRPDRAETWTSAPLAPPPGTEPGATVAMGSRW